MRRKTEGRIVTIIVSYFSDGLDSGWMNFTVDFPRYLSRLFGVINRSAPAINALDGMQKTSFVFKAHTQLYQSLCSRR